MKLDTLAQVDSRLLESGATAVPRPVTMGGGGPRTRRAQVFQALLPTAPDAESTRPADRGKAA